MRAIWIRGCFGQGLDVQRRCFRECLTRTRGVGSREMVHDRRSRHHTVIDANPGNCHDLRT